MPKQRAIYGGTFDPPTRGHEWMIKAGSGLFEELLVGIGVNPEKHTLFSLGERIAMLEHVVKRFPNVRILPFTHEYLVRVALSTESAFILRGLRSEQDFCYERTMHHINRDIDDSVTSVFLMPPREMAEVSSSMVKNLIGPDGWETIVESYVNNDVLLRLKEKYATQ